MRPEIWSYGHRNVQAATLHPETGQLWTVEHGARGGDELISRAGQKLWLAGDRLWCRLLRGKNRRRHQQAGHGTTGLLLGPGDRAVGGSFYTGKAFPHGMVIFLSVRCSRASWCGWKCPLGGQQRYRYAGDLGARIRDVQQGPDGAITSSPTKITAESARRTGEVTEETPVQIVQTVQGIPVVLGTAPDKLKAIEVEI